MAVIKIPTFAGMVPSLDKYVIDDKNAQDAVNTFLYSGVLRGLAVPVRLTSDDFDENTTFAFRIPLNSTDPTYLYDSHWMQFENADTDVISAPTAGDTFERYYWTSTSEDYPKYNTKARIIAGEHPYLLGIPIPGDITVDVTGGVSATIISRAYISTLVSSFGEEGPVSNPFLCESEKEDATFEITVAAVSPADMGTDRDIVAIRLYRTSVTANQTASFYLVHEFPASTSPQTWVDTILEPDLVNNIILEGTTWVGPPHLDGWAVMPNGIIVGYTGKTLHFSEPYRPHAWPPAYSLTLNYEVVGIAIIGQTAVVCTKGNPYTATGVNSFSMTTSMLASFEPCLSKGSIVPTEEGVYYTSPNGLILVNAGRAENVTKQFIARSKWNEFTDGIKANAARFGAAYYSYGGVIDQAFQADAVQNDAFQFEAGGGSTRGFLIDPTNLAMGFVRLKGPSDVLSLQNDYYSSELIIVYDRAAWWLDQRPGYKTSSYVWRSKAFQSSVAINFAAMKIYLYEEDSNDIDPSGHPQNFDKDQIYDPNTQYGVVRVFADEVLVYAAELRTSGQLMRLPSGYKAETWEIEFEGRNSIKSLQMATSVKELSIV